MTDGEKIHELERLVYTLIERVDNVRKEMIDKERLAVIEERLNEMRITSEGTVARRWLLWSAIIGAVVGGVVGPLGTWAVTHLK